MLTRIYYIRIYLARRNHNLCKKNSATIDSFNSTSQTLQMQNSVVFKSTMADSGNDEDTHHTANSLKDLDEDEVDPNTKQSASMQQATTMDNSMKFNDLLKEIEDENNCRTGDSNMSSISISICVGMGIGPNDKTQNPQHIGSKLQLDDLPLSPGSSNWGTTFMESFRKRMGSSMRLPRRKEESPKKPKQGQGQGQPEQRRRKKVVRFKKLETVFPS
jgi:hypothetical protein